MMLEGGVPQVPITWPGLELADADADSDVLVDEVEFVHDEGILVAELEVL